MSSYHGRHIHASGPSVLASDPDSYANGRVHQSTAPRRAELKTDAYWTTHSPPPLCPGLAVFLSSQIRPLFSIFSSFSVFRCLVIPGLLPSLCHHFPIFFSFHREPRCFLVFRPSTECPPGQSESRVPLRARRMHAFCGRNFPRDSADSVCTRGHPCPL